MATAGIALALWIDSRVDEEIRQHVERLFAEQYPDLSVAVRSAQLVPGEGIEIRGMSFSDRDESGTEVELAHFDEIFLRCDTDLNDLLTGAVEVDRIVLRRPTLHVRRGTDGQWNVGRLFPLPRLSDRPPRGIIENGMVEIHDLGKASGGSFTIADINLTLTPRLQQIDPQSGRPAIEVVGNLTADSVQHVELNGLLAAAGDAWQVQGRVEGLEISPELRDGLPREVSRALAPLGNLRGQLQCDFHLANDPTAAERLRFRLHNAKLRQGRIHDHRLPYPLTDLNASFRCDNQSWVVESLTARNGQMEFWLAGHGDGYTRQSPFEIELTSKRTKLDRDLVELFPAYRKTWDDFLPAGEIDVRAKVSFDGQRYRPQFRVDCRDVSFTFHKFPYRLEYATGSLDYKDNTLVTDISAYSGGRQIKIDGSVTDPGPKFVGRMHIRGDHLPLDEKLFAAFREPARHVVRDLNSSGTFNVNMTVWRDADDTRTHRHVDVTLTGCAMRGKHFPYPIDNIHGQMVLNDDTWTFDRLRGRNDSGTIICRGRFGDSPRGRELFLHFNGENIALEDELRDALKPNMRQMWARLRPQGAIDLESEFYYWPDTRESDVWVRGDIPAPERGTATVSIEADFFPLKLDKLAGTLIYRRGRVDLYDIRAENRGTTITGRGHFTSLADQSWHFHLEDLKVERLRPDRTLIAALPPRLAETVASLQPTGQFYLGGQLDFFGQSRPGQPVRSRWDLAFDLQRANLDCGIPLKNIHGGLTLAGHFDGRNVHARGELNIDSATFHNVQFTRVRGPFRIDDGRVLLGKWAGIMNERPRRITAAFYGGSVAGDGWIATGDQPRYGIEATVSRADLGRLAREGFGARQQLSGAVMADVNLYGEGRGTHNLGGHGQVRLREADIYELPVMMQLLSILSLKAPDDTAFTSSDIDFRIVNGRCFLEKINFKGDAVSLYGSGEMGFDKSVRLSLTPQAFRHEPRIPVFRELVRGASEQLMVIQVEGTVDQPLVTRRFFSGVDQAFQQLQADLQNPGRPAAPVPAPRGGQNTGGASRGLWPFSWR